jgi:ribosomal protein S18 acetylase RimI-like enzyme
MVKEIEYNQENILRYKRPGNSLCHARYIPGKTEGIMLVDNSSLVGFISWENDWITALFVDPKYRNQGIATSLLERCPAKKLSVTKSNKKAVDLYTKLGWVKFNETGNNRMDMIKEKSFSRSDFKGLNKNQTKALKSYRKALASGIRKVRKEFPNRYISTSREKSAMLKDVMSNPNLGDTFLESKKGKLLVGGASALTLAGLGLGAYKHYKNKNSRNDNTKK